jgi:hypothetical protein
MISQIAIAPLAPFVTAQKFAELTGMPLATVKNKIQRGEFPIREKNSKAGKTSRETPLINMIALTLEGAAKSKGNIVVNIEGAK